MLFGFDVHAETERTHPFECDQFCVYVADQFVLPSLSHEEITAIASARHQMDAFVRRYIHENLSYRFVILPNGRAALELEAAIKGAWQTASQSWKMKLG